MSLVLKDLECRSLASLDAGVIAHDFAIDGVPKRIYQAQDVLYLAELQTVVVDDFVPEEAITVSWRVAASVGLGATVAVGQADANGNLADVDFNVVGTDAGAYVELQATAEGVPFDRAAAGGLLDLADGGLSLLFEAQTAALATVRR